MKCCVCGLAEATVTVFESEADDRPICVRCLFLEDEIAAEFAVALEKEKTGGTIN